jgi:hypothetical protein
MKVPWNEEPEVYDHTPPWEKKDPLGDITALLEEGTPWPLSAIRTSAIIERWSKKIIEMQTQERTDTLALLRTRYPQICQKIEERLADMANWYKPECPIHQEVAKDIERLTGYLAGESIGHEHAAIGYQVGPVIGNRGIIH